MVGAHDFRCLFGGGMRSGLQRVTRSS